MLATSSETLISNRFIDRLHNNDRLFIFCDKFTEVDLASRSESRQPHDGTGI